MNKIIVTSDGSHTIYVPEMNEHYHSVHGAVQESGFIFIKSGLKTCSANPLRIFEAGFGTGLNALLTAIPAMEGEREIYYTTIEKYPLNHYITNSLNYDKFIPEADREIFKLIHSSPWNKSVRICRNFTLHKIEGDLTCFPVTGKFDLIYFDAFGPEKQPDMWSAEIFSSIGSATVEGGIFVTYSAKGDVKRKLRASGFDVSLIPGPPGKRQIIRAVKI